MSSKLLKYYASRRGLTLLMLADLAGVSQSTISRKYKIVWKETADKLAHVLEINREDFGTDEL
jgi:transcriptional regulator with XRE-family HTH domain